MDGRVRILFKIFLLLAIVLRGCEKMDPNDEPEPFIPSPGMGMLHVLATDAPFPIRMIDKAKVTLIRIELVTSADSVAFPLMEDTLTIDLLRLRNGLTDSLSSTEVPPGAYDQLRLYVDKASIVLKDGRTNVLKVPSGPQSGIKANFDPPIVISNGEISSALLDFDLSRSFVLKGNPSTTEEIRGFNFKPVLRTSNLESTGSLKGVVTDKEAMPIGDAEVWISADTIVASTFTNGEGAYMIIGIPVGTYEVSATKEGHVTQEFGGIEIYSRQESIQNFQLAPMD